jgi:hypothetical protein
MRSICRRLLAVVAATGAAALAVPVSGASAQIPPIGGIAIGGTQIGSVGCVGTNRPALGGNNGSTSAVACGGATYQGPQAGQLGSVIGPPTVIGSALSQVTTSAGSITTIG